MLAKVIVERLKPLLKQVIGKENQFIKVRDMPWILTLMKEIIEHCNKKEEEKIMKMTEFMKNCDRIDRETIEKTMRNMNFGEIDIEMIQLFHAESSSIVVTNDVVRESFRTRGEAKQSYPPSPSLFEISLELM